MDCSECGNVLTDFEVVKIDGLWYVSITTFPNWWYHLNSVTDEGA